jgi:hypothetical protein
MITTTPRLTILMVAMTVLGTGGPIAAFAQAAKEQQEEEQQPQVQDQEEQGNNPPNPT